MENQELPNNPQNENLFFAILQRDASGQSFTIWVNGSSRKDRIRVERFWKILTDKGLEHMIPDIKAVVLGTYSMYLVDFMNDKIGLLSALKNHKDQTVQDMINGIPGLVDAMSKDNDVSSVFEIGHGKPMNPQNKQAKDAPRFTFFGKNSARRQQSQTANIFKEYLGNLSNFTR